MYSQTFQGREKHHKIIYFGYKLRYDATYTSTSQHPSSWILLSATLLSVILFSWTIMVKILKIKRTRLPWASWSPWASSRRETKERPLRPIVYFGFTLTKSARSCSARRSFSRLTRVRMLPVALRCTTWSGQRTNNVTRRKAAFFMARSIYINRI